MDFKEIVQKANEVRKLYDALNARNGAPRWGAREYVQGLTGDVGDLTKLSMMAGGLRPAVEQVEEKLKHEVSDALWSTIMIAESLGIDLEKDFVEQMELLKNRIVREGR